MTSDKKPVQDFIALLKEKGISDIIITPGSRNAPFSISFYNNPDFRVLSIVDERSAAFFALGMSQQSNKPTVLICTSGTAALNYAPAIAEAYYQRIPLLIVTADRPLEWVDQGEGQTIRQSSVFANYVKGSFDLVQEASEKDLRWYNQRIFNEAIDLCTQQGNGPVHLNFPLRESLYGQTIEEVELPKIIRHTAILPSLAESEWKRLNAAISSSHKILFLFGQMTPNEELKHRLKQVSEDSRIAVFTETSSNLMDENWIGTIDRVVMGWGEKEERDGAPDLLVTFGRNIISRRIKAILRKSKCIHWHIDEAGEALDTFQHLREVISLQPTQFLKEWNQNVEIRTGDYAERLSNIHSVNRASAEEYVKTATFSDLVATKVVLDSLPSNSDLQMGNSAVVRYIQLFDPRSDLRYFGNRGVSGIDGSTSTAAGAAFQSNRITTIITGDLAFFYDINAFWNEQLPSNLKVIVVNNAGGGIFRIIEGPSTTEALETMFETTHHRSAEKVALMYDLPYKSATDVNSLEMALSWLYETKGCAIVEVHTPRLNNAGVLKDFFQYIRKKQNYLAP